MCRLNNLKGIESAALYPTLIQRKKHSLYRLICFPRSVGAFIRMGTFERSEHVVMCDVVKRFDNHFVFRGFFEISVRWNMVLSNKIHPVPCIFALFRAMFSSILTRPV